MQPPVSMNLVSSFFDLLYGAVPAQFESSFGLEESVRRLSMATSRSIFATLHRQATVGTVTASCVSLQRVIPFVGNSFKPFFIGRFIADGTRVLLTGGFTMHWSVKAFHAVFFGFLAFWTILALIFTVILRDPLTWWFPFAGVGMFLIGIGLVKLGKWFARNDIAWLSGVIRDALSGSRPSAAP
jgi:hypothetical protein